MPDQAKLSPVPLAGEPREREPEHRPPAARVGAWLAWWVVLMSFWIMLDDSLATDELLAGAGAAAIAALIAELASYQAATRFRMRFEWLVPALRLPGQVAGDTVTVYAIATLSEPLALGWGHERDSGTPECGQADGCPCLLRSAARRQNAQPGWTVISPGPGPS